MSHKKKRRRQGEPRPIDDLGQLSLPFIVPAWEPQDDAPDEDPRDRDLWRHLQQTFDYDGGDDAA